MPLRSSSLRHRHSEESWSELAFPDATRIKAEIRGVQSSPSARYHIYLSFDVDLKPAPSSAASFVLLMFQHASTGIYGIQNG
jgi:hypothetical protein